MCEGESDVIEVINRVEPAAEKPEEFEENSEQEDEVYEDADESDFRGFEDGPLRRIEQNTRRFEDYFVGRSLMMKNPVME